MTTIAPLITNRPGALRSTLAIARLTVGEALRSRYLLFVVGLGLVSMIYMAQGRAVTELSRLRLLRQSIVQTIVIITTISTLFLAAFALPADLESRRIYTIVSKPVSRATVFLGRFLGFSALALLMAALLGIIGQLILATSTGSDEAPRELSPRIFPVALHTWGAVDGPPMGDYNLPTKALDGPHEAGFEALFADLPPSVAAAESPRTLEFRFALRLHPTRHIRTVETATVVMRRPDSQPGEGTRQTIRLVDQDAILVTVPVEAFGEVPVVLQASAGLTERFDRVGTIVEIHLIESPFSVLIRPDSMSLRGPSQSPVVWYSMVLAVEMTRVIFLLAVVLGFSTALTPYTAILGGFFAIMLTNVTGTFRGQVEEYARMVTYSQQLLYQQGRPMDPSLQVGLLLGDPSNPSSIWSGVVTFIEAMPDAYRFPVAADYVAGYTPALADCIGAGWMFGTWALTIVVISMVVFSMREIP